MDAPQELAAQLIDCPNCKETIEVPIRSQHNEPPKPPEPAPKPAPARVPESKPPEVRKFGIQPPTMKTTNLLLAGIMAALVFIGVYRPAPIVLPPPAPSSLKWEYKVEAYDDGSTEMREYAKTHPEASDLDFTGEFGLMKIRPSGEGSTDWEVCAWFLEPKVHPKLILIFKRPVS
jgi:hypothetical protein